MRRREFVKLVAATAAWPVNAWAQQSEQTRHLGILVPGASTDRRYQKWIETFLQTMAEKGWKVGRNLKVSTRFGIGLVEIRKHAEELVALSPDAILAHGASTVGPLKRLTQTVPIIFPIASDPVAAGFVDTLARPGGNVTGFMTTEYGTAGKLLELLKEIAPGVSRAAVFRDRANITGASQFAAIQAISSYVKVEVRPIHVRNASEIAHDIAEFGSTPNGGLVVTSGPGPQRHRDLIVSLAARHKLPSVYPEYFFVSVGGLASYGVDYIDQYRRAAGYVDRVLRGETPNSLPVQAPTKLQLAINLKTAKALGIAVHPILLARADEVIE